MSRVTLRPRPAAVVPLATFESLNDPVVRTPADSTLALLDIPVPDAKRPPFDWDTVTPRVDPSVKGWPAVGMTQGRSIQVRLHRAGLDVGARLELRSSDPSLVAPGLFAAGHDALVDLVSPPPTTPGERRAAPRLVRIEALWSGQLVAGLAVYVHPPIRVKVHVHRVVSVQGTKRGAPGRFPSITDAMAFSNAIWAQAGIELLLDGDTPLEVPVKHEPDFQDDDDRDVARKSARPGVVNVFLFDRMRPDHPSRGTLGDTHGLSLLDKPDFGPPFLFLNSRAPVRTGWNQPDVTFWEDPEDPSSFSRTLSHELGHFFELHHPVFLDDARVAWVGIGRLLMCPAQPSAALIPCGYREVAHDGMTLQGSPLAREKILHYRYDV